MKVDYKNIFIDYLFYGIEPEEKLDDVMQLAKNALCIWVYSPLTHKKIRENVTSYLPNETGGCYGLEKKITDKSRIAMFAGMVRVMMLEKGYAEANLNGIENMLLNSDKGMLEFLAICLNIYTFLLIEATLEEMKNGQN